MMPMIRLYRLRITAKTLELTLLTSVLIWGTRVLRIQASVSLYSLS